MRDVIKGVFSTATENQIDIIRAMIINYSLSDYVEGLIKDKVKTPEQLISALCQLRIKLYIEEMEKEKARVIAEVNKEEVRVNNIIKDISKGELFKIPKK
jgi:uncharacterized protein (UPF0254 family)